MGFRILFVDDEFSPDAKDSLGSYMSYYVLGLEEAGFYVERARNVDKAIELFGEQSFDLAILDVMMSPGEAFKNEDTLSGISTGVFLAKKLHGSNSIIPILLLSNAAENGELFAEVLKEGVVKDVLFKLNVTPDDLVEEVKRFLTGGKNA